MVSSNASSSWNQPASVPSLTPAEPIPSTHSHTTSSGGPFMAVEQTSLRTEGQSLQTPDYSRFAEREWAFSVEEQWSLASPSAENWSFTVCTYNILADQYVSALDPAAVLVGGWCKGPGSLMMAIECLRSAHVHGWVAGVMGVSCAPSA